MLYLILFIMILTVGFISNSMAAVGFSIIMSAIGITYARKTKVGRPSDAQSVFLISFIVISLLALIRVLDIEIPDSSYDTIFKTGGDEDDFYEKAQIAAKQSSFFSAVFDITNTLLRTYYDYTTIFMCPGYHMYIGAIGYISNHFFDGNVIIVQLLGSCFWGCLLSVVLYKILSLYFSSDRSRNYALFGTLCTAFIYFSVCLLRDIHVTFLFALTFYTVLQPYNRINLIKIIVIVLITASFRLWSAIFMAAFVLYYLYRRFKNNKLTIIVLAVFTLCIVVLLAMPLFNSAMERLLIASRNIDSRTVEESGYLQILYGLPVPIKQIAVIASSYLTPFTAWNELRESNNLYHSIFKFTIVVYEFCWFFVVWLTSKWCVFNKGLSKMPPILLGLLLLVIIYMFISAASDFTVRRTMCMYPLMFLVFVYLKENVISKKQFKRELYLPLAFYVLGFVLFVVLNI